MSTVETMPARFVPDAKTVSPVETADVKYAKPGRYLAPTATRVPVYVPATTTKPARIVYVQPAATSPAFTRSLEPEYAESKLVDSEGVQLDPRAERHAKPAPVYAAPGRAATRYVFGPASVSPPTAHVDDGGMLVDDDDLLYEDGGAPSGPLGLSTTTWLLIAAGGLAAYLLLRKPAPTGRT